MERLVSPSYTEEMPVPTVKKCLLVLSAPVIVKNVDNTLGCLGVALVWGN